jgi:hypothetical protein
MKTMFDDAGSYGREFVESGMQSFEALTRSAQAIAAEAGDYTKSSYEAGTAALEKLMAASTIEAAVEIQTEYARAAYEGFVAEASKLGSLYTEMARNTYKPFESLVAKAA